MSNPRLACSGPSPYEMGIRGLLRDPAPEIRGRVLYGEFWRARARIFYFYSTFTLSTFIGVLLCVPLNVWAIFPDPTDKQVKDALERGNQSARKHQPPNRLYWSFGPSDGFQPHGFLMTKLSGLAVMSGHFALRGEKPSTQDIQRVVDEDVLQVVVMVFGNSPGFAMNSYLLLKQGDRVIKPDWLRFDARAVPMDQDQGTAVFRAKIVGGFAYGSFDPELLTSLLVFPGSGGQIMFSLNFSEIP